MLASLMATQNKIISNPILPRGTTITNTDISRAGLTYPSANMILVSDNKGIVLFSKSTASYHVYGFSFIINSDNSLTIGTEVLISSGAVYGGILATKYDTDKALIFLYANGRTYTSILHISESNTITQTHDTVITNLSVVESSKEAVSMLHMVSSTKAIANSSYMTYGLTINTSNITVTSLSGPRFMSPQRLDGLKFIAKNDTLINGVADISLSDFSRSYGTLMTMDHAYNDCFAVLSPTRVLQFRKISGNIYTFRTHLINVNPDNSTTILSTNYDIGQCTYDSHISALVINPNLVAVIYQDKTSYYAMLRYITINGDNTLSIGSAIQLSNNQYYSYQYVHRKLNDNATIMFVWGDKQLRLIAT